MVICVHNLCFWTYKGISFSVRVTISALTVLSLCLIWWYTELERRLLVVRHHLSDSINLFNSPLASGLYIELLCCLIHVPPSVTVLRPEWQLLTFIRLYHIVKVISFRISVKVFKWFSICENIIRWDITEWQRFWKLLLLWNYLQLSCSK